MADTWWQAQSWDKDAAAQPAAEETAWQAQTSEATSWEGKPAEPEEAAKASPWGQSWDSVAASGNHAAEAAAPAATTDSWAAAGTNGSYAATAAPAADSWGGYTASAEAAAPAATESWGNWGASTDAAAAQPAPSAKAYWEMQRWNIDNGILSQKSEVELQQDEVALFETRQGTAEGINFDIYKNVPVDVSGEKSANIPCLDTFEKIYEQFREQIHPACVANVRRCGYRVPTPVQQYAVPVGLAGRDIMCCAQTGSGKTAAFLIPTIGVMMKQHAECVGERTTPFEGKAAPDTLVMTPTRELCIQIHEEALKFTHRTGYRCVRIYGGEATKIQLEDLSKGCDLMVACPGRLQDFLGRGVIDLSNNYLLVLDEADRMLDMGFESQVRDIVENHGMPAKEDRQTMMFSATFPEACQRMAQDFLWDYIWIGVGIVGGAVTTVTQNLKQVQPEKKFESLIEVLDQFYSDRSEGQKMLVFVNAKDTAKWLDEQLYEKQFDTGALHGNLTQQERETNLGRFRKGDIDVMVATDVAARGLDIEKVDLVVNYDMPNEIDTYVHRIGRSGRIGNSGSAVTFISVDERGQAFEHADTLAKLLKIMQDAGSQIPDWLEQSNTAQNDSWDKGKSNDSWSNWGGKDMRGNWWDEKTQ